MIHVIATIQAAAGRRGELVKAFGRLVPEVLAEAGCIEYGPAIDVPGAIDALSAARPDVVTVVEKWQDVAALRAHLAAPHVRQFREIVKDLVAGVEIRVLQPT